MKKTQRLDSISNGEDIAVVVKSIRKGSDFGTEDSVRRSLLELREPHAGKDSRFEEPRDSVIVPQLVPGFTAQGRYIPHDDDYPAFQFIHLSEVINVSDTANPTDNKKAPATEAGKDAPVTAVARGSLASIKKSQRGSVSEDPERKSSPYDQEKKYAMYMEKVEDKVLTEVPLPIQVVMYDELTEVLKKTASAYKKLVGKNHALTKKAEEVALSVKNWSAVLQKL